MRERRTPRGSTGPHTLAATRYGMYICVTPMVHPGGTPVRALAYLALHRLGVGEEGPVGAAVAAAIAAVRAMLAARRALQVKAVGRRSLRLARLFRVRSIAGSTTYAAVAGKPTTPQPGVGAAGTHVAWYGSDEEPHEGTVKGALQDSYAA